ncbi:Fc.00g050980.m01.CDS01 [Cosmosporella sp. VM-42]
MRFLQVLAPAALLFSNALAQNITGDPLSTGVTEQPQSTEPAILTGVTDQSQTTRESILTSIAESWQSVETITEVVELSTEIIVSRVTENSQPTEPATTEIESKSYENHDSAYITVVTTDYTTYCPSPTTFIHKNATYTATTETILTITNCPCTITYQPVVAPTQKTRPYPPQLSSAPVQPSPEGPSQAPPAETIIGGTQPVPTNTPVAPTATQARVEPTPAVGSANRALAGFGALVVAGVAAILM